MLRSLAVAIVSAILGAAPVNAADPLPRREWKVGDISREALVYAPASATAKPTPVVFAFHGHGGTMKAAAQRWAYHTHWPEAICVYMQGLPTPGKLTDPEGKRPGWQHDAGEQGNRDLLFFDMVLATLRKEYQIDEKRIYVTGHSNGGRFCFLLWAVRPDVFAAVAPSGSPATNLLKSLKPKPCLHVAGEKDALVKIEWQQATMAAVRKLNGCDTEGKPDGNGLTVYPSGTGTPFVTYLHPGGHMPPVDAPEKIVAFFKRHAQR